MKNSCLITLAAFIFFFLADNAFACSVCGGGTSPEKADAYMLTTVVLGAMPIIIGIILFFKIRGAYKGNGNENS